MLNGKNVLLTGGTGSFGKKFTEMALKKYDLKKLVILSRDELKQFEMAQKFTDTRLRYFLGDVRDKERLQRAFYKIDVIIHAAALKQVPAAEYNPFEFVKTNILGAENIINVAIDSGVEQVIALSTDKACNPINLYGATKLCSDKLFISANSYAGGEKTRFAVVRYGNVVGSRGSVIPFFKKMRATGTLPITDPRMTRFWITLEQGVQFVFDSLDRMVGGELFVPKIPSMNIMDLAKAVAPDCKTEVVGIRPGEKLHEVMISEDDSRNVLDMDDYYVVKPSFKWWDKLAYNYEGSRPVAADFRYSSEKNDRWLKVEDLREMLVD
jgi:UDP-N-acetylglucosamine 4,6-dehydratase